MATGQQNAETRKRRKSIRMDTKAKLDVMCSAIRFELLEFLHACGPCSIAELAAQVGTRADGLYHHIRKLVQAELVEETGFRRSGRRTEALYDVVADDFKFNATVDPDAMMKLMRSIHRRAERNFEKALNAGVINFSDRKRTSYIRGETARLTTEQQKQVKHHLAEIIRIFQEGRASREGSLTSLTFDLMPLVRDQKE